MTKQRRDVATSNVARTATDAAASLARRASGGLQRDVLNPLDKLAFRLSVPPAGDALLETIGRRTGEPRVTPVCNGLVGDTFWIIAQRGRRSGYVRNIEATPRVRVKVRRGWRTGTAHILDDDGPRERERILGRGNLVPERRWSDPRVSPLHAPDMTGLPAALIVSAEHDPLREESEAYAARLREAGVEVELRRERGLIHNFMLLEDLFPPAPRPPTASQPTYAGT